ncbi:hypothetical protein [Lederbergia galactosidilytica]|uniref:hypothetical protein n=1 Tax=Lederbergia galactosidilytica TaxID=217031 RepID=UPI000A9AB5EE|nr:hypothetical protein [Lederbergia galactosidilytica]
MSVEAASSIRIIVNVIIDILSIPSIMIIIPKNAGKVSDTSLAKTAQTLNEVAHS